MVRSTVTPSSLLDAATGDLVLRICGSTRHGQIVRLRSAKCTIGSAARCTLRLRARGVGPMHCLILRGSGGTVIRRWSVDTRLNGRAFADAELSPGDRLSIGAIELEVLESGWLPDSGPKEVLETRSARPPSPLPPDPSPVDNRRLDELTARLALAGRQGRQRVRRLVGQLRATRQEIAQLKQHQSQAVEDDHDAHLQAERKTLQAQRQQLQRQHRQWQAEQAESEKQLNERTEQLNACGADLDARSQQLQRQFRQWQAKRAESEKQLNERTKELDAHNADLDTRQEAFEQRHRQWEAQRAAEKERLNQLAEQLDTLRAELEPRRAAVESEHVDLAADTGPLQESEFQEQSKEAPVDLEDVFRRMGSVGLLGEDEPEEVPVRPEPEPTAGVTAGQSSPASKAVEGEQDESIDGYMTRLMERVQATGSVSKNRDHHLRQPGEPAFQAAPEPVQADEPSAPQPAAARRREPADLSPRAVAPEKSADLSAMRELANVSAHTAIDRHTRQQMLRTRRTKLLITIVGLAVGGVLLWMWWAKGAGDLAFYTALVSFLVALFWGVQYAVLSRRMIVSKAGHLDWRPGNERESEKEEKASLGSEPCPLSEDQAKAFDDGQDAAADPRSQR